MINKERLVSEMLSRKISPSVWQIHAFDELDSTNTEARRMVARGEATPAIVLADAQSNGRGRMGRSFFSPGGTGLYFSLLFESAQSPKTVLSVTSAAAVAVRRAIRRVSGIEVGIKWVNDLYLNDKKVAGILAESLLDSERHCFILGIGINLSTAEFPSDLASTAGCLDCHGRIVREALLAEILTQLCPYLEHPEDRSWLDEYRSASTVLGRRVRWMQGSVTSEGIAEEIDSLGSLLVRGDDGTLSVLSTGEITLRRC